MNCKWDSMCELYLSVFTKFPTAKTEQLAQRVSGMYDKLMQKISLE